MAEVLLLNGKKVNWLKPPKATDKVKWSKRTTGGREVVGSLRTIAHLDRLNNLSLKKFGVEIQVIQGPYNTGVAASAGTHDFDCCLDLWIPGVDPWVQQRFFRANGFMDWYRHPPLFGNHQHGFTLPPREGRSVSDDFKVHGFKVGEYVDGGWSTHGALVTSSQIQDGYNHAFGLANQHTPGSDKSWWPEDIGATVFDLDKYVASRARKQRKNQGPAKLVLRFGHASGKFSDSDAEHAEDASTIFARGYHIITGTEAGAGSGNLPDELAKNAERYGYRLYAPEKRSDGWIAVSKEIIDGGWKAGFIPVLPGAKAAGDPHPYGPKGVVWVSFHNDDLGTISVATSHYLTKGRKPGQAQQDKPGDPVDHYAGNRAMAKAIAKWGREMGAGAGAVAFYAGDQNIVDRDDDTFFGGPFTSAWDELGKYENTGHGNIDVIASYDGDKRVKAKSIRALDDSELHLNSDHYLVEARYEVISIRPELVLAA